MGRPSGVDAGRTADPARRSSTAASENRTVTRPPGRRHLSSRPACSSPAQQGPAPRSSPGVVRLLGRFALVHLAGRPVETDPSPASWLAAACEGQPWATVASLVPPVFDAYARVFHPAIRYRGDDDVDVSWAEIAAANGTTAHPLMEWGSITGSMDFFGEDNQFPLWDDSPAMGHLPEHVAERLAAVLGRHTTTPDECWFGLSDTWVPGPGAERLTVGRRGFWLVRGPVGLAAANLLPE